MARPPADPDLRLESSSYWAFHPPERMTLLSLLFSFATNPVGVK
jgi:hypothetical protein